MKKRLLTAVLVCVILAAGLVTAAAEDAQTGGPVNISIDGESSGVTGMLIDSTTYVPIREFCSALGATRADWDGDTASVTAPGLLVKAYAAGSYIVANGRYLLTPGVCRIAEGELIVPVRALARAFDAVVVWDGSTRTVYITKGSGAILPGNEFYSEDDVLWMSRIIKAEAGNESFEGKIAVGNVVMNRVNSQWYPDTVYGVVFDKRSGIQFTPAYSGAIYNTPGEDCVIAAKIALDGGNIAGQSLYFSSRWQSCWAARNRPFTMTIGNHSFYA